MGDEGIIAMGSHATLVSALVALVPVGVLFAGSAVLLVRRQTVGALLQLLGAGCLVVVVLAHVCEALHLFPSMGWGLQDSLGHYLDLSSALLGLALFPAGYLAYALRSD